MFFGSSSSFYHSMYIWMNVTVNWLDHNKTLREQSVDVNETLLLRRKYFFSDQNVDARDPVQLNLLYVQVSSVFCKLGSCAKNLPLYLVLLDISKSSATVPHCFLGNHQFWLLGSRGGRNQWCQILIQSVQGLQSPREPKIAFLH